MDPWRRMRGGVQVISTHRGAGVAGEASGIDDQIGAFNDAWIQLFDRGDAGVFWIYWRWCR